jgi:hypothetical protein
MEVRAGQADAYCGFAYAIESSGLDTMKDVLQAAATPAIMRDAPQLEPRIAEEFLPTILRGAHTGLAALRGSARRCARPGSPSG